MLLLVIFFLCILLFCLINDSLLQTLIENGLRERVILRVDGGFKSGVDVMMAAAMGADEYGFGSVAMIATGCVMARICHTNNCPVGVASQVLVKPNLGCVMDIYMHLESDSFKLIYFREKNYVPGFLVCLVILLITSYMLRRR